MGGIVFVKNLKETLNLGEKLSHKLNPQSIVLLQGPIGAPIGPCNKTIDCGFCLLYTSPSPRDATLSRMPSSA